MSHDTLIISSHCAHIILGIYAVIFEIKSSKRVITTEIDNKYLYVYIIVRKNDEKKIAKLGDVYMVERLNN